MKYVEVCVTAEEIVALYPELWKIKTRKRLEREMDCKLQAVSYIENKIMGTITVCYEVLSELPGELREQAGTGTRW